MGKNIYDYTIKTSPVEDDFVVGTDSETGSGTNTNQETVNFRLEDIAALGPWRLNSSLSFMDSEFVGVGTDSPIERFTVADGNLQIGDTNSVVLKQNSTSDYSNVVFNNSNTFEEQYLIGYGASHSNAHQLALKSINSQGTIGFYTAGNNEQVIIKPDGKVGIKTSNPVSTLHLVGVLTVDVDTTTSSESVISMKNANIGKNYVFKIGSNDGFFRLHDESATATRITVNAAGKVGIAEDTPLEVLHVNGNVLADAYNVNSDIALKDNIQPMESMIQQVKELGDLARNYTLKKNRKRDVGFIAQDVEKIFPDAVSSQSTKSINYQKLTVYMAKAFSELCDKLNI